MPCLLVFHITNAGLCGECETDGAVLPSLESFQLGMVLPKVMFIFYEYFLRQWLEVLLGRRGLRKM